MLNFTSFYYGEATKLAKSLTKTKESGFRPSNFAIFFLTKYTMIHKCQFCTNLSASYIARGDNSFDHPVFRITICVVSAGVMIFLQKWPKWVSNISEITKASIRNADEFLRFITDAG